MIMNQLRNQIYKTNCAYQGEISVDLTELALSEEKDANSIINPKTYQDIITRSIPYCWLKTY